MTDPRATAAAIWAHAADAPDTRSGRQWLRDQALEDIAERRADERRERWVDGRDADRAGDAYFAALEAQAGEW